MAPVHTEQSSGPTNSFFPVTRSRLSFSRLCVSGRAIESETVCSRSCGYPMFFATASSVGKSVIFPYPAADEASDRTEHEASEAENPLKCVGLPAHSFTGT